MEQHSFHPLKSRHYDLYLKSSRNSRRYFALDAPIQVLALSNVEAKHTPMSFVDFDKLSPASAIVQYMDKPAEDCQELLRMQVGYSLDLRLPADSMAGHRVRNGVVVAEEVALRWELKSPFDQVGQNWDRCPPFEKRLVLQADSIQTLGRSVAPTVVDQ